MPSELDLYHQIDSLKSELQRTKLHLQKERDGRLDLEAVIEEAAVASFNTMAMPPKRIIPDLQPHDGAEVAIVTTADWQLGKITPDYDSDVTRERVMRYVEKVARITEIQRKDHPVNEARLWVLGDIVEGEQIFPGQEYLIDSGLIDQIHTNGLEIMRNMIYGLLEIFPTVHVVGVIGNHGRIGSRGRQYHPGTNADRMLYRTVKQWFEAAGEERVTFHIPESIKGDRGWYAVDHVGNYSALLVHGDQFRGGASFAGLPYYSFTKKVLNWRDMTISGEMPEFKDVYSGHWHTDARVPVGTSTLRVAGTPESYNMWSIETLARTGRPSQLLLFAHPERGIITSEYVVYLDE